MAEISASLVKELREETGVGMMECKKALVEANGDKAAAVKILRESGMAIAAKKASRTAKQGIIAAEIAACQACALAPTRLHVVPGQGALKPDVMFVGEGPGADEDEQGLAFVGRAGQLLTKLIHATGYTREQVFTGNLGT